MASWRINTEAVDAVPLIRLSNREFRKKFKACLAGEINEFSPFVHRERSRQFCPEWARLRALVFNRDNFTCQYCGVRGMRLECDHIIPFSRGGDDALSNLVTACKPCNQSKRAKLVEEWKPGWKFAQ